MAAVSRLAAGSVSGTTTREDQAALFTGTIGSCPRSPREQSFMCDDDSNPSGGGAVMLSDGRWLYTWDAENRLIAAETVTGLPSNVPLKRFEFDYDYQSRRVAKREYSWSTNAEWQLTADTRFLWNGWLMLSEFPGGTAASPSVTNWYVNGLDLSGTMSGAGGIGGVVAALLGTNAVLYTFDGNGNVSELINSANGGIDAHYEYSAYGETVAQSGPLADANPIRFSTKYLDELLGLYYYGYRHYSPALGRWLSRDPIGEMGGLNEYGFVVNNPVNNTDVFGLSWWNPFSWFRNKVCCNNTAYDAAKSCCCKDCKDQPNAVGADLIDRKDVYTGLSYFCRRSRWYHIPIYRPWAPSQFFLQHCWFNMDNGAWSAGAYPNSIESSGIKSPEDQHYRDTEGTSILTFEKRIELSPCEYKISEFRDCVKNEATLYFNWTLYDNCRDWVVDTIKKCKKQSEGCAKYP